MLYQIDNLRVVVETAKRLLTKEQMEKRAGQSTTSPFMQVNQGSSKSKDKMEKKVSFSAVEAMERTTNSIERLASLLTRWILNWIGEKINIGPEFTKVEVEDVVRDKIMMVLETDHIVETSTKITIGEEETTTTEVVIGIIGPIIGITVGPEIETITEMVIDTTIDQITEGKTVVKGMVIEVRTTADPGIEIEIG